MFFGYLPVFFSAFGADFTYVIPFRLPYVLGESEGANPRVENVFDVINLGARARSAPVLVLFTLGIHFRPYHDHCSGSLGNKKRVCAHGLCGSNLQALIKFSNLVVLSKVNNVLMPSTRSV